MFRNTFVLALSAAFAISLSYATEPDSPSSAPINRPAPIDGKQMFATYCTSCHGSDGKGYGPVTVSRGVAPVDLTVLSRKNHGTFPEAHVVHVLKFGADVPSHTSVEMPVWGPVLGKINQKDPREGQLRINSLSSYLETIQVK